MDEYVQEKVNGPGMALLVVGVLSILGNIASGLYYGITIGMVLVANLDNLTPEMLMSYGTSGGLQAVQALIGIFVGGFIAFSGSKMRNAQSATLVYAGAVLAMLPCCVGLPCCCIGLPVGVWVIMTMQDDQVKASFS